MQVSDSLKRSAEDVGISLSHYDIDGHLIYAPPETLHYFTALLQPPSKQEKGAFDDVLTAFENEPIHYDLARLSLSEPVSLTIQLLDEQGKKCVEQTCSSSQLLLLP